MLSEYFKLGIARKYATIGQHFVALTAVIFSSPRKSLTDHKHQQIKSSVKIDIK